MDGPGTNRGAKWFVTLVPDEARIRCSYLRIRNRVERFTVQLELLLHDGWVAVVRYDNAHGFCHRDVLHADGSQEKINVYVGDTNATFTYAIDDLRTNWEGQRLRFLREVES